jgi:hypothetical protein
VEVNVAVAAAAVVVVCRWVVVIRETFPTRMAVSLLLITRRTPLAWMIYVVLPTRMLQTEHQVSKCLLALHQCSLRGVTVVERWALVAHRAEQERTQGHHRELEHLPIRKRSQPPLQMLSG